MFTIGTYTPCIWYDSETISLLNIIHSKEMRCWESASQTHETPDYGMFFFIRMQVLLIVCNAYTACTIIKQTEFNKVLSQPQKVINPQT